MQNFFSTRITFLDYLFWWFLFLRLPRVLIIFLDWLTRLFRCSQKFIWTFGLYYLSSLAFISWVFECKTLPLSFINYHLFAICNATILLIFHPWSTDRTDGWEALSMGFLFGLRLIHQRILKILIVLLANLVRVATADFKLKWKPKFWSKLRQFCSKLTFLYS